MTSTIVLGISGGSGSGKSTLVDRIMQSRFGERISLLPHDAYYLGLEGLPETLRRTENWDHPDALDNALYLRHLDCLLAGQEVQRPVYDFATHSRTRQTIPVASRPVLLLEGILLLAIPEIRDRIDLRVFVDTPADLRLVRRTIRDIEERGRNIRSVAEQYQATVRPMHEQFVEPNRVHAHLIVPWIFHNEPAVEVLLAWIEKAQTA